MTSHYSPFLKKTTSGKVYKMVGKVECLVAMGNI
jgi:hypothetical protein